MSKAVRHQLDRADPGIQRPLTITVAIAAPFWCAFVAFSTQLHGHLQLHQLLSQHAHTFAKKIGLLHAGLAQHVYECRSPFLGHRCGSLSSLIWTIAMRTT